MNKKITFSSIRKRNQLISFFVFLLITVTIGVSLIKNPWYQVPVDWYFIPILGIVGSIITPALMGRHYCGQYCPTGFLSDVLPAKNTAGKYLKSRNFRYVFMIFFVGIFAVSFSPLTLGLPESMRLTYWSSVINKLWILWLICPFAIALPLVVVLGFAKGGRTWCNYICPWGTIGVSYGKSQLQISKDCTNCKSCTKVCSQPEVLENAVGTGGDIDKNCLLCLKCLDACPSDQTITFK